MEKPGAFSDMTVPLGKLNAQSDDLAVPSGKDRHGENFPVGSRLIHKRLRPHVHAYYRFARMGDDIADDPSLDPKDKIQRLDRMERGLSCEDDFHPIIAGLRASLSQTGVSVVHCTDLLVAFRMDATKNRYASWSELMEYCRYSAAPVGRYLLDLHGESETVWPYSDALCAALQVINHLQDCQEDFRVMDRVYIPLDYLAVENVTIGDLDRATSSAGLRSVSDRLLRETELLMVNARLLPSQLRNFRIRAESAVIVELANRLVRALRQRDPLAAKVKLKKTSIFGAALKGLAHALRMN